MGSVESFVRLFRGRADAYGSWAGGCIRKPLTEGMFERHLFSHDPNEWFGVYNVIGRRCSWGVVDIDNTTDSALAMKIRNALAEVSIPAWVERTAHGFHTWVFPAEQLIEARTMRRALTAACHAVDYRPKEVFPKQDHALGHMLGNYVRLPLNGSHANPAPGDCRRFIHPGVTLQEMDIDRASTSALEHAASYLPDPQPVDHPVNIQEGVEFEPELYRIGGKVLSLWRDGPKYGHDRSGTLVWLAHELHERDVEPSVAFAIVSSADRRWGKYSNRGEAGETLLRKIITEAYA